jgi:hypothetical protein
MEWAHVGRCFEATHCKAGTAFGVWCSVFGVFGFDHPKGGGQEWTNFLWAVEVVSIS